MCSGANIGASGVKIGCGEWDEKLDLATLSYQTVSKRGHAYGPTNQSPIHRILFECANMFIPCIRLCGRETRM